MYRSEPTIRIDPDPSWLDKTTDIHELWKIYEERALGVLSPNTLTTRKAVMEDFISVTAKTDITKVDKHDLERFKARLLKKGCAKSTVKSYLGHVGSFLYSFGINIPIPKIRAPKDRITKIMMQIITWREFKRLLEVTGSLKYKVAFVILWELGLRVGRNSAKKGYPKRGLLGLNWGDINFKRGTMVVHRKGDKKDIVPLGKLSERYLKELKESGNEGKIGVNDPVFVSRLGNRLSYEEFKWGLKKYMKDAEIPEEKRRPHAFRHTCGTRVTKKYGVHVAKELLGHEKITTTMIYVHIASRDDLMEKLRPDKVEEEVEDVKMKVCPECSFELLPDRVVCVCGYDFTLNRCPSCGKDIKQDDNFCPYCGVRIGVPKTECVCGHELKREYKLCPGCGRPIDEVKKLWKKEDFELWERATQRVNAGGRIRKEMSRRAKAFGGDLNYDGIEASNHEGEKTIQNHTASSEQLENKKATSVDQSNCSETKDEADNCKPYETRIIAKDDEEGLIRLSDEGWDLRMVLPDGRYLVRRSRLPLDHL